MSDRKTTPKYWEVKMVYAPIAINLEEALVDGKKQYTLEVINRNHHVTTENYLFKWNLTVNGKILQTGEFMLPSVQPGKTGEMLLPSLKEVSGADVRLHVAVMLKKANDWAEVGHEVTSEQFAIHDNLLAVANQPVKSRGNSKIALEEKIQYDSFQAFRAPTDNDRSFGNWLAKDWRNQKMDTPEVVVVSSEKVINESNKSIVKEKIEEYKYANGSVLVTTIRTIYPDGTIDIEQTYQLQGELPELPRLGALFTVSGDYDKLSWYGRGPHESYPDRKSSTSIGRWNSTVADQYTHYPRPQDGGNHEEVSEVLLTNKKGQGIRITALDKPFSFSALPYRAKDLSETSHDCDLVPREEIMLSIDTAVLGLGNSSCGPGVLKKYAIDKHQIHTLKIRITNL